MWMCTRDSQRWCRNKFFFDSAFESSLQEVVGKIFLTVLVASAVSHYYLFLIVLKTGHVIHLAVFVRHLF
jgi:hypothetical protein